MLRRIRVVDAGGAARVGVLRAAGRWTLSVVNAPLSWTQQILPLDLLWSIGPRLSALKPVYCGTIVITAAERRRLRGLTAVERAAEAETFRTVRAIPAQLPRRHALVLFAVVAVGGSLGMMRLAITDPPPDSQRRRISAEPRNVTPLAPEAVMEELPLGTGVALGRRDQLACGQATGAGSPTIQLARGPSQRGDS